MKIKRNSGDSIQLIANVIMLVGVVFGLLFSVLIGWVIYEMSYDDNIIFFLVGVIIFALNCLLSWVLTCLIRGFGELVEYAAEAATYLETLATPATPNAHKLASDQIACPQCGKIQAAGLHFCRGCGYAFDD